MTPIGEVEYVDVKVKSFTLPLRINHQIKGKYADVPYGSEDLIRDKRAEVESEDRCHY